MAQTVELGIKINVNGNKEAADGIDQVTAATTRMGASAQNVAQSMVGAQTNLGNSTAQLTVGQLHLLDNLRDQAAQAGLNKIQLLELQAAELGVSDAAAPLIAQIAAATAGHNSFSLASAGATRELAVLGREIANGNIDRLAGSMSVLASRAGWLPMLFSPVGAALVAVGAAIVGVAYEIVNMSSEIDKFNNSMALTNNYAGQTRDSMATMAASIQTSATGGISAATTMLSGLAATGKFTGGELAAVGQTALKFSELTGQSSDQVIKYFAGMTSGVANWAEEANKSYHFLTAAQYEHIVTLEKEGKSQQAVMETMHLMNAAMDTQQQHVGPLMAIWKGWGIIIDDVNASFKKVIFPTLGDSVQKATADLASMRAEAKAAEETWGAGPAIKADWDARIAEQKKKIHDLIAQSNAQEIAVGKQQADDMSNLRGVAAQKELDQISQSLKSQAQLRADAAAKIRADADEVNQNAIRNGTAIVYTTESVNEMVAASNAQYADKALKDDPRPIILANALKANSALLAAEKAKYDQLGAMDDLYHKFGVTSDDTYYAQKRDLALAYEQSQIASYDKDIAALEAYHNKTDREREQTLGKIQDINAQKAAAVQKYNADVEKYDAEGQLRDAAAIQASVDAGNKYLLKLQEEADKAEAAAGIHGHYKQALDSTTIAHNNLAIAAINANIAIGQELGWTQKDYEVAQQFVSGLDAQNAALGRTAAALALVSRNKLDDQQFKDAISAAKQMETELTTSFGNIGTAIGSMTTAFVDYGKTQHDIQTRLKSETDAAYNNDMLKKAALDKANLDSASAQMKQYGDIAGAAAQFFDKNSKGYAVMQDVEKSYRLLEMALTAESLAKKLFAVNTETSAVVAGEAAKGDAATSGSVIIAAANWVIGNSAAAAGVANQASGDPYTAWARMAAMAAVMVGLGYVVSGSGGSAPDPNSAAQQQATQGTGTVMGDAKKQSDSIVASLKMLVSNSSELLPLTSQMAASLQSIVNGISGVANILTGNPVSQESMGISTGHSLGTNTVTSALATVSNDLTKSFLPMISNGILGKVAGFLLGSTSSSVTDTGLQLTGTVGQLAQGSGVNDYANVQTTTKGALGGLFGGNSTSNSTVAQAADAQTRQTFALIFSDLESTFSSAATAIGANATAVGNAVAQIPVQTQISLQGLTGTALTTALQAVLSKQTDLITQALVSQNLLPNLNAFAQVGEGYMTTLVRVASGVESANVAMSALGLTAISYTDILNKQGDVTTEIERQTIVGAQTVTTATTELIKGTEGVAPQLRTVTTSVVSGIGQIIQSFTGSAADMVTLYQSLLTIQGMLNDTALKGNDLSASMIQGAGGTSNLNTGLANYMKDYFSPAEQSATELKDLSGQFTALGLVMPTTKAGFRDLVSSIDTSTSAGQKLLGKLLSLAGAFSDAMDHAAALTTATTGAATAMTAITQQMDQVRTLSKSIDGSIQTVAQNTPGYDMGGYLAGNVTAAQTALDDLSGGSLNDRISAAGTLQTAIMASYNYQYQALQTQVQAEQSAWQAGQQAAAQLAQTFKGIGDYAASLLTSTLSPLSDQQKLAQAQAQYQDTLARAKNGDATAAQALQGDANIYLTASRSYYASGSQYNDIFNNVQQALSALGSSGSNSLASVTQSGFQMSADLQKKMNDLQTQTNTQLTALKTLTDKWQSDLQASLDAQAQAVVAIPAALAAITTSLSTLDVRIGTAVAAAIAAQAIATAKTSSTATTAVNGSHASGLVSVPFDGYRAELHEGEGVIDAPAMAAMRRYFNAPAPVFRSSGDNGATVAELREQNMHLQALVTLHSAGYQALLTRLDKSNVSLDGIKKKAVLAAAK